MFLYVFDFYDIFPRENEKNKQFPKSAWRILLKKFLKWKIIFCKFMTKKKKEYPWHEIFSLYPYRAEKERSQYFGEVNDLRHSLDTVANEKVLSCEKKRES